MVKSQPLVELQLSAWTHFDCKNTIFSLEHLNFTSLLVLYVFIQPEQEHECKEETGASKEMPDVVPETDDSLNETGLLNFK